MSLLKKANQAFRDGDYVRATELYARTQSEFPELQQIIQFNLELIEKKVGGMITLPKLEEIRKLPITALIITWDVGHNPLGRSYMLAEAMKKSIRNVVLAGFQFPRYGDDIWEPVRDGKLPVITLEGKNFPEIIDSFEHIVNKFKPDVVIACKARIPSVELGLMFKEKYNIPLIIDIDDHELSFFKNKQSLSIEELESIPQKELQKEVEPYSETWTRLTEDLCKYADETIVSNVALQKKFGGIVLPHVRDEEVFNPILYNKEEQRSKYQIAKESKVVMFFGTPRHHKGVNVLAEAVGNIKDESFILVVVGTATDKSVVNQLDQLSKGKIVYLPNQPFTAIAQIICMADIICLPQDEGHAISKYQLPAKAIDAIGMGIPLLVSKTEPLMQLVKDGVAKLIGEGKLSEVIQSEVTHRRSELEKIELRRKFIQKYSYHSAALSIKKIVELALKNERKPLIGFNKLLNYQKALYKHLKTTSTVRLKDNAVDIVIFWKQNDTGLYGRRSDMVIKYLASRDDVRKVIVFDAPISEYDLVKMQNESTLMQGRQVYERTYSKILGKYDSEKVSYNVFAHKPGIYTYNHNDKSRKPLFEGYSVYISEVLKQEGVIAKESVFWFYPKNYLANEILDFYKPKRVVVDVVDDHRAWPNVSDHEKSKLTQHYKEILKRANLAMANCQPVVDSMKQFNKNIKLIPNGCEENPEIVEPKNSSIYEELKKFKGNVIGFVGNLEAKIDIELIEKIAQRFSDDLIVLVGSTHMNLKVHELKKYSNIRMFGVVPYRNINAIVSRFDVGIVPHIKMGLTNNMNPLKVFVYLANKVPVVVSNIENIEESELIKRVNNHDEFLNMINNLLTGTYHVNEDLFNKYKKDFSWTSRLNGIVSELIKGMKNA